MASMGESMANKGKAVPEVVKLSTAHSEQILIDMRNEGISPKMKTPKACALKTVNSPSSTIDHVPP